MAAIFVPGPSNFPRQEIILVPFKIPNRVSMAMKCSKSVRSTPLFLFEISIHTLSSFHPCITYICKLVKAICKNGAKMANLTLALMGDRFSSVRP